MKNAISLRDVQPTDLPVFFEHQLDPDATRMAAFPARDHTAFMAHWERIMADETTLLKTILFQGMVAGNILCWDQSGEHNIGYWLGKDFWGKGIASAALSLFLTRVTMRPMYAHVAKHNIASIRVLQKCGFSIAREEKFPVRDGEWGEEFIMTLGAGTTDTAT